MRGEVIQVSEGSGRLQYQGVPVGGALAVLLLKEQDAGDFLL